MNTRTLENIKEVFFAELDDLNEKGDMSRSDLEDIRKLTETIKNIDKIMMLEGQEYSGDSGTNRIARNRRSRYSSGENDAVAEKLEHMMTDGGLSPDERNVMRKAMEILKK